MRGNGGCRNDYKEEGGEGQEDTAAIKVVHFVKVLLKCGADKIEVFLCGRMADFFVSSGIRAVEDTTREKWAREEQQES